MTENEAVEVLKNNYPKTCKMVNGRYQGGFDNTECNFGQALTMAIKALKEIQQYREIGTVEECREAVEKQKPKYIKIEAYCPAYCPTCRFELSESLGDGYYKYFENLSRCPNCGQAIQWENLEEMEDE